MGLPEAVANWLTQMEAPHQGLYRLSKSAFHSYSIDATSLALDLRLMLGHQLSGVEASLSFFDDQQEEETGFYQEPYVHELDLAEHRILEMSGTYFGYQVAALLMALGRPPRYPYAFYEQFLPRDAMENYMDTFMPWNRSPMGAGNMVDHGATMMRANDRFGDGRFQEVLARMYAWLSEHQDTQTGLWGSETAQGKNGLVQGGYHLMRGLYFADDHSPAYPERIMDTVLASLRACPLLQSGAGEGCHDMDHFVVLERMLHFTNGYRLSEVREACEVRLEQIKTLRRLDGAFSFEAAGSITNHNRYTVTPGFSESDLVGTVFYLETIYRMLKVLGHIAPWRSSTTHGVGENLC